MEKYFIFFVKNTSIKKQLGVSLRPYVKASTHQLFCDQDRLQAKAKKKLAGLPETNESYE